MVEAPTAGVARRVLVADDQASLRLLCRLNLEADGMIVYEAANGRAAVDVARRELPDVILLDLMMPDLDGWGVADELLTDPETARIAIAFMSARAEGADVARGLEVGVAYVTKPFDPVELAPLIECLLERVGRGESSDLRREGLDRLRAAAA
jgi:DNA-binding response OmpR family regulator